jgi:hypothetical protein
VVVKAGNRMIEIPCFGGKKECYDSLDQLNKRLKRFERCCGEVWVSLEEYKVRLEPEVSMVKTMDFLVKNITEILTSFVLKFLGDSYMILEVVNLFLN